MSEKDESRQDVNRQEEIGNSCVYRSSYTVQFCVGKMLHQFDMQTRIKVIKLPLALHKNCIRQPSEAEPLYFWAQDEAQPTNANLWSG
ncbi:hypothetical protein ACLKA6_012241 [Drosophila palustris]